MLPTHHQEYPPIGYDSLPLLAVGSLFRWVIEPLGGYVGSSWK